MSGSFQLGINANFTNVSANGQIRGSVTDTSNAPGFTWTGDTDTGIWHPTNDTIGFTTNSINRLFINSNIGINTQTPTFPLDVNGAIRTTSNIFCGTVGTSNTPCYSWAHDSNTGMFSQAADTIGFATNGTTRVTIDSNINVSGNFIPTANEAFDLGTSNLRFRDLYLSGNTIFMGSNFSIGTDSNNETFTLLNRSTMQPAKVQAKELVLSGPTNQQKVLRADATTGALKFFNRVTTTGVETEDTSIGTGTGGGVSSSNASITTSPNTITATARNAAEDKSWLSVTWSPELNIFVAVASDIRVMTSPDSITWTARTTPVGLGSVCWSPSLRLFAAVGWNSLATSPDGTTWTSRTVPTNRQWQTICWSPERSIFVVVDSLATSNVVLISLDGITWTSRTTGINNGWTGVCWSPQMNIFVAVAVSGTGNRVMTSPDAITWTARSTTGMDQEWYKVCWSPERGMFVTVARNGTGTRNRIMTSADGIVWITRVSPADHTWQDVTWSSEMGLFIAVANSGTGNRMMTSPDGITWTLRSTPADSAWVSVCWSPQRNTFVAVSNAPSGSASNRVMTIDVSSFPAPTPVSVRSVTSLVSTARQSAADNDWRGICWSPQLNLFVAVSNTGTGNRVMTSRDGITWVTQSSAQDSDWLSVCWAPELGLFCAVGDVGSNRVMTSSNGITWTTRTATITQNWASVCWSSELRLFAAVAWSGTGNRIMTSADGTNWTNQVTPEDNQWFSVCWSPQVGRFVAVSGDGTNRVMTSDNGTTWVSRTAAAANIWRSVCWSPELGLFCAVAQTGPGNRVMTSPNGITWTARQSAADNNWFSVCWSAERSMFVAVSTSGTGNREMTSPDGFKWTLRATPADNQWISVCWSPQLGIFAAVANTGTGNRVMTMQPGNTAVVDGLSIGTAPADPAFALDVAGSARVTDATPSAGLVTHYPFDGNANDVVGTNSLTGTPAGYVTGKVGQAVNFTHTAGGSATQRLSRTSLTLPLTISFWLYPTNITATQIPIQMPSNGTTTTFEFRISASVLTLMLYNPSSGVARNLTYSIPTINTWYHIIGTVDAAQTSSLYVNSLTMGTNLSPGSVWGTTPLYIGAGDGNTVAFNGAIDDFRIYNRVLTPAEVTQIYQTQMNYIAPRLGVGVANPQYALDVAGGARFTGALIAPLTWVNVSFLNSWSNWDGSTFYPVSVAIDMYGYVNLRGAARSSTTSNAVLIIPAGYRPARFIEFGIVAMTSPGIDGVFRIVTVDPSGNLTIRGSNLAANVHVSFDNIRWPVAV